MTLLLGCFRAYPCCLTAGARQACLDICRQRASSRAHSGQQAAQQVNPPYKGRGGSRAVQRQHPEGACQPPADRKERGGEGSEAGSKIQRQCWTVAMGGDLWVEKQRRQRSERQREQFSATGARKVASREQPWLHREALGSGRGSLKGQSRSKRVAKRLSAARGRGLFALSLACLAPRRGRALAEG